MNNDMWVFQTREAAKAFIDLIIARQNLGEIALVWPCDPELRTVAVDNEQTRQLAIAFYWGWEFAVRATAKQAEDARREAIEASARTVEAETGLLRELHDSWLNMDEYEKAASVSRCRLVVEDLAIRIRELANTPPDTVDSACQK
jgi:hypothetical protein